MQDDQEQQKTTPNEINDGDEKADLIARAMHKRDTVAQNLDVVIEEARVGYTRVRMQVTDYMLNGHGTVHGGYSFILADIAFGYACNSHGQMAFAQSAQITYLSFGRPGEILTAVAEERSQTNRTGIFEATVFGDDGRVVAEFRGMSRTVKGQVAV